MTPAVWLLLGHEVTGRRTNRRIATVEVFSSREFAERKRQNRIDDLAFGYERHELRYEVVRYEVGGA